MKPEKEQKNARLYEQCEANAGQDKDCKVFQPYCENIQLHFVSNFLKKECFEIKVYEFSHRSNVPDSRKLLSTVTFLWIQYHGSFYKPVIWSHSSAENLNDERRNEYLLQRYDKFWKNAGLYLILIVWKFRALPKVNFLEPAVFGITDQQQIYPVKWWGFRGKEIFPWNSIRWTAWAELAVVVHETLQIPFCQECCVDWLIQLTCMSNVFPIWLLPHFTQGCLMKVMDIFNWNR